MSFALAGVGFSYPGSPAALADIDFAAAPGERIALIGPSGAGKTTLLSLLATALAPTIGRASVLGADSERLAPADRRQLRCRIGSIHQAPPLPARQRVVTAVLAGRLGRWPAWKGLSSLVFPRDLSGAQAALARVDLAEQIFRRCDRLSGGQLQRVAIARVLYQEADLILADEPVSALDPALALATVRLLAGEAEARGATLVTSLHAVDLALACFPRIVGVKAGRIAFDRPVEAVDDVLLRDLYSGEGLPLLADQRRVDPRAAANDPASRAACC